MFKSTKRLTTDEFIRRAKEIHGNKYDYSRVQYASLAKEVEIICPTHGVFKQTAASHIGQKSGCQSCYGNDTKDKSHFIRRSKEIHGDTYDYSKSDYVNNYTKVVVTCKVHGDFMIVPHAHYSGKGCNMCGNNKPTTEEFIARCETVWGDLYTYGNTVYGKNKRDKVLVTCRIHGDFLTIPSNFVLHTHGCPKCSKHGYDRTKVGTLYVLDCCGFIGYGITTNLKTRMSHHRRTLKPYGVTPKLIATVVGDGVEILNLEGIIKKIFEKSEFSSGLSGFKTEAVDRSSLNQLLRFLSDVVDSNTKLRYNPPTT